MPVMTAYKQIYILLFTYLLTPAIVFAAVPAWQIIPTESSLTFTATQNNAPVTGEFKKFSAEINFDPDQLKVNSVKIIVDMNSISDPYNQLSDTLKGSDWFNTSAFPQAVFASNNFIKTGDKTYQANGVLTIRDKKLPVTLNFSQEEYTKTRARIKGRTSIKRTDFGVGQGDWADTKTIKDEVEINFVVTAVKK
jgi:polyisoprenoid-binding protein YceI